MARIKPLTQDWESMVIQKKAQNADTKKDEKVVNAACRAGVEIESIKKSNVGMNRVALSSTFLNTMKLDEDTENLIHDRVPTVLKKAIIQAQLAQIINEKPQIIQEYESGLKINFPIWINNETKQIAHVFQVSNITNQKKNKNQKRQNPKKETKIK
ncbi:hypothetical protein REPUB_Repub02eG0113100 [Reevesia pubescens]